MKIDEIVQSVDLSMILLKFSGIILVAVAVAFLFFIKRRGQNQKLSWKKIFVLGLGFGVVNAGVNLTFGKIVYFLTPLILGVIAVVWLFKRFPSSWQLKHVLTFSSVFLTSSMIGILGVGTIFFHLAVEGKI